MIIGECERRSPRSEDPIYMNKYNMPTYKRKTLSSRVRILCQGMNADLHALETIFDLCLYFISDKVTALRAPGE